MAGMFSDKKRDYCIYGIVFLVKSLLIGIKIE